MEGSLEELVLKAQFEEAKGHELAIETSRTFTASKTNKPKGVVSSPPPTPTAPSLLPVTSSRADVPTTTGWVRTSRGRCFNCGLEGHMARACPAGAVATMKHKEEKDQPCRHSLLTRRIWAR